MRNKADRTGVVVIPTYNERENLPRIVEMIHAQGLDLDILVVDDNSPDGTGALADELVVKGSVTHVLHRSEKRGLGSAYVEGFRWALKQRYPLVFQMDADFSHNPESLPHFLRAIKSADLVVGSRYVRGITVVDWPLSRLLLSYFANMYARFVTGMPLRDLTGGFKCIRREVLETIELDRISSEGYSFQIEVNFRAWHHRFRIVEIPIVFRDRQVGTSKMDFKINREAAWMVWKIRIRAIFRRL